MTSPLPVSSQCQLDLSISSKISSVKEIENDIPAILVIIQLPEFIIKYISESGKAVFNVTDEELNFMGPDFQYRFLNPAETSHNLPLVLNDLRRNDKQSVSICHQARPSPEENFSWYLSSLKIILRDFKNEPLLALSTSIPIDENHFMINKINRLLDENEFLRHNCHLFESLTRREVDVLKLIALGHGNENIADKLFISEETAATHRKNIKRKLKIKNYYDFIRFAQSFDLI